MTCEICHGGKKKSKPVIDIISCCNTSSNSISITRFITKKSIKDISIKTYTRIACWYTATICINFGVHGCVVAAYQWSKSIIEAQSLLFSNFPSIVIKILWVCKSSYISQWWLLTPRSGDYDKLHCAGEYCLRFVLLHSSTLGAVLWLSKWRVHTNWPGDRTNAMSTPVIRGKLVFW